MAPAKPPTTSITAHNLATSMSPPVSLLWAHQLRREHSALLARVEDLASVVSNVSAAQLNKLAAQATKADKKLNEVASEQAKCKKELERVGEHEKGLEDEVTRLSSRLEGLEHSMLALPEGVRTSDEKYKEDVIERFALLERQLRRDQEVREQQLQDLQAKIGDLQHRLPDMVKEGVIGVRDSVEDVVEQMDQTGLAAALRYYPSNRMADIDALQESGLVHPSSEQAEMLTLQPNANRRADLYPSRDVDLDGDVATPEPDASRVGQTQLEDAMAVLPEFLTSGYHEGKELSSLKQGKYQSWDDYLAVCKAFTSTMPKRKEGAVVEAFVDGIYDEKLRQNCETILDDVGWTLNGVKDFVEKHVIGELETQARQRIETLTHKHRKGEVCPLCHKKGNVTHDSKVAITITDKPPQITLEDAFQIPQTADLRRRSQRILLQSLASPVAPFDLASPISPENSAAKPSEKRPAVAQSTSVNNSAHGEALNMAKKAKEKLPATGAREFNPTWGGRDVPLAEGKIQQRKKLETSNVDRTAWKGADATPQVLRNEKKALLKPQPPSAASFAPITPTNPTVSQNSLDLGTKYLDTTTDTRQELEVQGSRKRKLIEQLEVPAIAEQDLTTPLDRKIQQSELEEPERKRKRKRRAVPPIPMIPILPLSDDD